MKNRIFVTVLVSLALAATPLFAGANAHKSHKPAPARIVSISQSGNNVNLKLDDGRSIDAPQTRVHIVSTNVDKSAQAKGSRSKSAPSLSSLAAMNGPLPAAATVIYAKDGSIRKVRIQVFDSGDATTTFVKSKAGSK